MPELFERAVEQAVSLRPDLFVLSGDLLDYPLDSLDDPLLQEQAREDYELVAHLLEPISCANAVVYGNHDHPAQYHEVLASHASEQTVGGYQVLTFLDEEGPGNVPQRTDSERDRFIAAVSGMSSLPQIHIQHYVVWPQLETRYPYAYGDGEALQRDIISSGSVRLVLSGHYHRGTAPAFTEGVWFATAPAFCEHPHPFWVYELAGDDLEWRSVELAAQVRNG